jgi:hypothetical protein
VVGIGYSYLDSASDVPFTSDDIAKAFTYAIDEFIKGDNGCVKKASFTGLD